MACHLMSVQGERDSLRSDLKTAELERALQQKAALQQPLGEQQLKLSHQVMEGKQLKQAGAALQLKAAMQQQVGAQQPKLSKQAKDRVHLKPADTSLQQDSLGHSPDLPSTPDQNITNSATQVSSKT